MIDKSMISWEKHGTYSINEEGVSFENDTLCVTGTNIDTGEEIGHYLIGQNEHEVSCCINFKDEDGGFIFINRQFAFNDISEYSDDFFREKIITVYNKLLEHESQLRSIFD